MIKVSEEGLCEVTKYHVNGRQMMPTQPPLSEALSYLPPASYCQNNFRLCESLLAVLVYFVYPRSPKIWKRVCVFMKAGSTMKAGARRTKVFSEQGITVWTHTQRTPMPWTSGNPRQQREVSSQVTHPQKPVCAYLVLRIVCWTPSIGKQGSQCDSQMSCNKLGK